jgi:quinol monooxygenase YgiN
MLDLLVTQRVKPGMEKEFEQVIREVEANTRAHDRGCLRYEWYRAEAPQTYILIERWTDLDAAKAHLSADHLTSLMPKFRACVPENFIVLGLARVE